MPARPEPFNACEIREERPDDIAAIREVNRLAFDQNQEGELVDAGENLVAVCDIDSAFVERQLAGRLRPNRETNVVSPSAIKLRDAYQKAVKYADFREMLEKEKGIDAVIIATPG